jgi:hypothetical protein
VRRSTAAALLLMALAHPGAPALGADLLPLEDACRGRQLMIQGPIVAGDYERFVTRVARLVTDETLPDVQEPDTLWTVRLDSPGGDAAEAMRIGRFLREAYATTEVSYRFLRRPDGVYDFARDDATICLEDAGRLDGCVQDLVKAECAGACLLVWLAGAERFAHEGQLGLHGIAASEAGGGPPSGSDGDDPAGAVHVYLAEMGVPQAWAERMLRLESEAPRWLAWPEREQLSLRAASLHALIESCPAALTPAETFEAVTSPSRGVREQLMARAEAHRTCRLARLAAARGPLIGALRIRAAAAR